LEATKPRNNYKDQFKEAKIETPIGGVTSQYPLIAVVAHG